jgi:hypothetical protein
MASQQTHAAIPVVSPQPPKAVPAAEAQRITKSQALRPHQQLRSSETLPRPATILPPSRNISKVDRLQADRLRVPLNGVIQNQGNLPELALEVPQSLAAGAKYLVVEQVVEAIHSALDVHRGIISKADRIKIAQKVSDRLQPELRESLSPVWLLLDNNQMDLFVKNVRNLS